MQLGFFIPHAPREAVEMLAQKADRAGFDFMCCDDHLMSPFADMTPDFEGCYEAWTLMAYLAAKTRNIQLSHMVLVPSFRGPAQLAKMAATLDVLSQGRLNLTLGAGWYEREFEAYNIPWERHRERIAREREAIQIIRSLWTGDAVRFEGDYYTLKDATVLPGPVQSPAPPIWIGGDSKQSMELAAELGDGWLMHGHSPKEVEKMLSRIKPLLGTKADDFGFGTAHFLLLGADKEAADKKLRQIIPETTWNDFMKARIRQEIKHRISGSLAECVERLKQYAATGLTRLILVFLDPADVDLFMKEILPQVNR